MPRVYPVKGQIAVYRMFSASGELLYIGQSVNPAQRLCLHRTEHNWLPDVASMTLEWFETREAARAAEASAIRAEGPVYNVDHQVDATERRRAIRAARGHYLFGHTGAA